MGGWTDPHVTWLTASRLKENKNKSLEEQAKKKKELVTEVQQEPSYMFFQHNSALL